jgi:hypothetical protein
MIPAIDRRAQGVADVAEVERLMAAARKTGRYGHRDATMLLLAYRHGHFAKSYARAAATD